MEKVNDAAKANYYATEASKTAIEGDKTKEKLTKLKTSLKEGEKLMKDSPILLFTSIFFLSIFAEIIFSWEMYKDVLSKNLSFIDPAIAAVLFAAIIVLLGAIASHFLALFLSNSLQEIELNNLLSRGILKEEADKLIHQKSIRKLMIGLLIATLTLFFVFYLSNNRINLFKEINDGISYDFNDVLLPVLFVALEIIFGIYATYAISKLNTQFHIGRLESRLEHLKLTCKEMTSFAFRYYQKAEIDFGPSSELKDAIYRHLHLSINDKEYFNQIDKEKTKIFPLNNNNNTKNKAS